jgi:hypothetical protein
VPLPNIAPSGNSTQNRKFADLLVVHLVVRGARLKPENRALVLARDPFRSPHANVMHITKRKLRSEDLLYFSACFVRQS